MHGEIDYTCSETDPGVINVTDALAYVICPFGYEAHMLVFEEKGLKYWNYEVASVVCFDSLLFSMLLAYEILNLWLWSGISSVQ